MACFPGRKMERCIGKNSCINALISALVHLGIVAIISVFMGAVSTVANSLPVGKSTDSFTIIAQIVRDTVILEFAPTLVCIVLAGVVGSKIASELGNMRVSEQIDALEIMGINTKTYLVLPKIVAARLFPCGYYCRCTWDLGWKTGRHYDRYCSSCYI